MTYCIKTGAYVHLAAYDAFTPADLYACGGMIVVRVNPQPSWAYEAQTRVTHVVHLPDLESRHFTRTDLGIFVVPKSCVEKLPYEEPAHE